MVAAIAFLAMPSSSDAAGALLSLGRPAGARSSGSGHVPADANDGSLTSHWVARSRSYPQHWTVDLGARRRLGKAIIHWQRANNRAYGYRLLGSNDRSSWKVLKDRRANSIRGRTSDTVSGAYRFVRVKVLSSTSGRADIREVRIYGVGSATLLSGPLSLIDAHDCIYDGVDFEGSGSGYASASGLVYIQGASHDITFRNCTFGTNQDGVGNGVKIVDTGSGVHDIRFVNCVFKYQPRMGFECIGREVGSAVGYRRVDLVDCTFEASASEAISYDDNNGTAGDCTVSGNLVKGAGVGSRDRYGKVFEINGTHDMTVVGNTFRAGRDGILNLQMHDTTACGWVFSGNTVDATRVASGITVTSIAQPVHAESVYGGKFSGNTIINLDSWNIAYLSGCHNMDWRTTIWRGPENVPYQTDCAGNLF